MIKIFKSILLIIFISGCSIKDTTGFWTNEKNIDKAEVNFKPVFKNKKRLLKEFNSDFRVKLDTSLITLKSSSNLSNNDGYVQYNGKLKSISKYSFSKIGDYDKLEPDLVFHKNGIIFFDNRGSILNFDYNSKLIWKKNNYENYEKKIKPLISMNSNNKVLIVADNLSKYYAININDGKILWSKNHQSPFNSQIKIYKDKFFIVDLDNNIICYSLNNGDEIWSMSTNTPFINSQKKLSIVINKNLVIFSNSLGEITAINVESGMLEWQISTQNSNDISQIINLKTSDLIVENDVIYFSNNKNFFYSISAKTGKIFWKQEINSSIRPAIIGDLVFTISDNGYLFLIDKNKGNIIRINDLFINFKSKLKKKLKPTGFILNTKNIYVSTNLGMLLIVNIEDGNLKEIIKVGNNKISRPFTKNRNIFLIKNNSIVKLN